jgi:hypothetical protein
MPVSPPPKESPAVEAEALEHAIHLFREAPHHLEGAGAEEFVGLSEKSEGVQGPRRDSPLPCHPCPPLCIAIDSEPDCVS